MDCKKHSRENAHMKVIECNEEKMVLLYKVTIRSSGSEMATQGEMVRGVTHFEILGLMWRRLKSASKILS